MAGRGIKKNKLGAILNGTLGAARNRTQAFEEINLPRPSITTVCGLHDRKGVRYLLEAFDIVARENPDVHLNIIGEGPQEEEYKNLASSLRSASSIKFWGQLRDPRPYLRSTDIFVLASLQDPCPLVIPEAREMGCAIVATDVDGIPEMLRVGNAGLLVIPSDSRSLAQAISSLLNNPDVLKHSKKASLSELDYFNIKRVSRETMDVYYSLIANHFN
jgi:glycosyltransferase involved in cell wall biosynthesis